jgi:hypothetical protein
MGMMYWVHTGQQSVGTAAQDLLEGLAPSDAALRLHAVRIDQGSDTDSEQITATLSTVTGAPTSGSGGGTAVAAPTVPGSPAAGGTYERNNTTQLTGGTAVAFPPWSFNVLNGMYETLDPPVEVAPSTRFVLALATVADALSLQAAILVEEVGG